MAAERIWEPSDEVKRAARITEYTHWLRQRKGLDFPTYDELWRWSVDDLEAFWGSIAEFFEIPFSTPHERVLVNPSMPGARWFPGARLNYVDQVFSHLRKGETAIVFRSEAGEHGEISWEELRRRVASLGSAMRAMGIGTGDRVAAYLPNIPETVIAFLATASIGAIWSACSPDMGAVAVLDRFRQIAPKVLITVDGYRHAGKAYDRREAVASMLCELPSVERVVLVPCLDKAVDAAQFRNGVAWGELIGTESTLHTEQVPFDHPLWVVYSSGTTGLPKPIVHGHGGVVLEHVKLMALHNDLGPHDRFHWYSSTGWIMWNCQVAGLLVGATLCLYDGSPGWPDMGALWRFAGEAGVTFFGAGAAFYVSCMKAQIEPNQSADLSRLRAIGSTGSPLPPEAYRWVYEHVRSTVWLTPIAGGTDFAGCFVAGLPTLPVFLGEMQCRCLGAKVEAFDEAGLSLADTVGELVCTRPMPSMPLMFWNDTGGQRYRESYFEMYPGIWRHGDWVRITPSGGAVIYGRSDTTINRQGVRMGTSELYRAVEGIRDVADSLVVDLEYLGRESYMPLFVVLQPGAELSAQLQEQIRARVREALSPRHVPSEIVQVPEVPRTLSGKKLELPVKNLLLGGALEKVVNRDSMANPSSLDWFIQFAQRRAARA